LKSEKSLGIHGGSGITFLYTAIPSRPLHLLYFDGESAALTASGSLDSQSVLLRGTIELNPSDSFTFNESARGDELCALVKALKIDGVMRMNAGFEVLACDVKSSGIQELHVSNVTVPGNYLNEENPTLPRDPNRQPPLGFGNTFSQEYNWDWIRSAAWHYGSKENRVQLNFCGMISLYDPSLTSLSGKHVGGIRGRDGYDNGWGLRRGHRLLDISASDAERVRRWVERSLYHHRKLSVFERFVRLFEDPLNCSGVNWQTITEVATNSHRSRALEIAYTFEQFYSGVWNMNKTITRIHDLSHGILAPFFEYPKPGISDLSFIRHQTIARCASLFTSHLNPNLFNDFESLLQDSIQIVPQRLCTWEWSLFEWSEDRTTNLLHPSVSDHNYIVREIAHHANQTRRTLKWVGWDTPTDCPQKCAIDVCFPLC
jgi:hypothetical protein